MSEYIAAAASFGQGQTPTICVVNEATAPLGVNLADLVAALQIQANDFAKVWGTPCRLVASSKVQSGCWSLLLLDNADQAGALGYHDLTPDGLPQGKAFVQTSEADNAVPSTVASHELLEMLADPDANTFKLFEQGNTPYMAVMEVCDAVEQDYYVITLPDKMSVQVSDWVYPAYFESFAKPGSQLDKLGLCKTPFEIRPGGYLPVLDLETLEFTQLLGAKPKSNRPRNRSVRRTLPIFPSKRAA